MGVWQTVTYQSKDIVTFDGDPVTFDGEPVCLYGDVETVTFEGDTVYFCPDTCAEATGGAARFGGLSRGMLVIDEEAWEEEGVILPLTLDAFP